MVSERPKARLENFPLPLDPTVPAKLFNDDSQVEQVDLSIPMKIVDPVSSYSRLNCEPAVHDARSFFPGTSSFGRQVKINPKFLQTRS